MDKVRQCHRIGIVGAGTAGLASAIFLSEMGHTVDVFERTKSAALKEPVGAGIGVQPIGLTVLKRLGVLDNILSYGSRIDRLHSTTREGRTVLDLKYSDFRDELFGIGLHRSALFGSLFDVAKTSERVNIITDADVRGVERSKGGRRAVLTMNNTTKNEGPYDLVVVCDGRDSVRSKMTHVRSFERKYRYGCLWSILPDVDGEFTTSTRDDRLRGRTLCQRLDSAKIMLGFLPSGKTPLCAESDPALVSLFWSLPMDSVERVRSEGLESFKETVIRLEPRSERLLDGLVTFDQLIPASYSDTFMPKLFDEETSTVFIGDCAHATSPQLGQGANLALVDAWVLAKSLHESRGDIGSALVRYDRERRWRLRFYQLNSRMLTPVFQSDSKLIGALRDATMGYMCNFPLTKLQMLTVLCGAQNNGIPWTTIPEDEFMGYLQRDELPMFV